MTITQAHPAAPADDGADVRLCTLADVRDLAAIGVWSNRDPSAAGLFRPPLSRSAAYEAAKRGDLPTVRIGGRVLVPVTPLRRLLGDLDTSSGDAPDSARGVIDVSGDVEPVPDAASQAGETGEAD